MADRRDVFLQPFAIVPGAEGKLVGVVKASDALEIARKEATEDMQLMVGLSGEEGALTPCFG